MSTFSTVLAMGSAVATDAAVAPVLVRPYASLQFSEKVVGSPQISPVKGVSEREVSSI